MSYIHLYTIMARNSSNHHSRVRMTTMDAKHLFFHSVQEWSMMEVNPQNPIVL